MVLNSIFQADSFQADIYPPAPSLDPSLNASQYFSSSTALVTNLVNLDSGKVFEGSISSFAMPPTPASAAPTPPAVSSSTTAPPPTKTYSAPPPEPAPIQVSLDVSTGRDANSRLDQEVCNLLLSLL